MGKGGDIPSAEYMTLDLAQAVAVFNNQTDVVGEWMDERKEEREGGRDKAKL